jgi:predicted ATPase/DNA-binding SARP family transcriptional activator
VVLDVGGLIPEGGSSPVVRIGLFGGVSAVTDGGKTVDVGPAKCQTVLAVLALSVGSVVPVPRLVELVWGEEPPRTAGKTLQSYVVRLRKGLGPDSIVRTGAAYRLAVEADAVDVARFRRRLDVGDIEAALAEWTGTPLAGLDAQGLTPMVDGLVEQWLGAVEIDLERRVETDAPAAIGPLTELTANHPFREGLWSLLMTALYRVGRQADALAAFQKARRHLVEQLGIEPGPRLRDLESLILDHDEQLRGRGSPDSASGRPTGTVTFGFCDVEGSSRLWATQRKKMAAAIVRLDELVRAVVDRHGGYVFATGGESFGAAFHRADDASAWATELQLEVSREPWPGGVELRLRIGLHTGETDERAKSYFGPAVNAAARLAAVGHGGQTLVSGVTSALLDRSDLPDLGTYRLDGDVAGRRILQLDDGEHPPLRTEDSRRGNLPLRLGRLIGRDEDLDVIADALAESPVVTLVGPGGIGKTRLALAAAQMSDVDRASGAWLIELAGIASSSDVPRVVADTLEVKESSGRTLTQSIVATLQSRPALLVLDNCEHVIDGAAELAHAIAERCPSVRVLATSREALGIGNEQLIAVAPLDPAGPGAELFNERARAVSQTFDAHAHRDDVEEICRRLDGVPLAIELAAARTRSLAPPDLVERLGDRLRLLTGGRRTSAERHRTLRATIDWSYDLLTRPQQVLFQRLSIFAGPFDLAAAGSVAAEEELDVVDIDDLLGDLVERSMIIVESGPFGRRFRLLETIREFAAEHLSEDGSTDLIAGRHAQWCRDKVTHIHRLLVGPAEIEGVARLGQLWPNLRAGFDRACATRDRELADALVRPVATEVNLRKQGEISDWAERILAITPPDDEEQIVYWLAWATYRYMQSGGHDGYERLVHRYGEPDHPLIRYTRAYLYGDGEALRDSSPEAVTWLRRKGEDHAAALTEIAGVASGLMSTGHFEELDGFVSALVDRSRAQGPPTFLCLTLAMLGYSALFQGNADQADRFFDESASIDVPDRTISVNKPVEARSAFRRGNRSRAFRILRSHVDELLETDYTDVARLAAVEFVNMMAAIDRLHDAARVLGYLAATGDFGALALRTLVADAAGKIAAGVGHTPDLERPPGQQLDARQALEYMRDVLDELADDQQITN